MPGDPNMDWDDFRSGRKLSGSHLQLLLLALLAEKPAHGYELIKSLEERSGGFYAPSPGMVYPALTYLEEVGYAAVEPEGAKKQYRITDEGRGYLGQHRGTVAILFAQLRWVGEKMEHMRRAFADESAATDDQPRGPLFGRRRRHWMSSALYQAGLQLKAVLFEKRRASEDEQRRMAEILERAAAQIRGDDVDRI